VDPSVLEFKNDDTAIAKAKVIAIGVSLDKLDPKRHIAVLNEIGEQIFSVPVYSQAINEHHVGLRQINRPSSAATLRTQWHGKKSKRSQNQKDVRTICRHPKHDPVRRLGLAALPVAVVMILLVVLPSPWPI